MQSSTQRSFNPTLHNYADSKRQLNQLRVSRGFFPVLALTDGGQHLQVNATGSNSPSRSGSSKGKCAGKGKGKKMSKGSKGLSSPKKGKSSVKERGEHRGRTTPSHHVQQQRSMWDRVRRDVADVLKCVPWTWRLSWGGSKLQKGNRISGKLCPGDEGYRWNKPERCRQVLGELREKRQKLLENEQALTASRQECLECERFTRCRIHWIGPLRLPQTCASSTPRKWNSEKRCTHWRRPTSSIWSMTAAFSCMPSWWPCTLAKCARSEENVKMQNGISMNWVSGEWTGIFPIVRCEWTRTFPTRHVGWTGILPIQNLATVCKTQFYIYIWATEIFLPMQYNVCQVGWNLPDW